MHRPRRRGPGNVAHHASAAASTFSRVVLALVTVIAMRVYRANYSQSDGAAYASLLAITAGIAVGVACGFVNGVVDDALLSPFVAHVGMYSIARGRLLGFRAASVELSSAEPKWIRYPR